MSPIIALGRVLRCQDCGTPYEAHPDATRDTGHVVMCCPTCIEEDE